MSIISPLFKFWKRSFLCLITIGVISFVLRMYYFPYGVSITLDGLDYFSYAMELSKTGKFPEYPNFANNGWPSFLSIFFSLYKSQNFLDYIMIQRYLSVTISVLTIVPAYLFCGRFFPKKYAMIGASLFAFDPRLITNS